MGIFLWFRPPFFENDENKGKWAVFRRKLIKIDDFLIFS